MLYKKSREKQLDSSLFLEPTSEYRAAPFWAWNSKLDKELLLRQIGYFKEMGMGGFHIHCRVGLDTEYLGETFFDYIKACRDEAKKQEMLCWLYDEDRWPSGTAGGIVTKDEKFRARFLVLSPLGYEEEKNESYMAAAQAIRSDNRILIGKYKVILDRNGYMSSYEKVLDDTLKGDNIWEAHLEVSGNTPWFNNQAYVNTLDKDAIDCFIETTYEKYYDELKESFGKEIPAIFTDEPQTSHKEVLSNPFEKKPVILPFTDDFDQTFQEKYGMSVIDHLPELIWEMEKGGVSQVRYYYHIHICEMFSEAFGDKVGQWCNDHGIYLTGHMMSEWTLYSQTLTIGEVMRPLKNFGLPGIDMLCDRREISTAKQVQSVARQFGREGVMSEIYGVTGWTFDFRNHKLAGDWQAALGVTARVPHLAWVSMEGEGKRDYPASIGYQSPWYKEYSYIEDHFARLNTALTRGEAQVKVGVIHPIESYWLYWGNQEQTSIVRQTLESNFENVIDWLLYGLIDFDFISEALLSQDNKPSKSEKFTMGEMDYDVIIIPDCHTLRQTTVNKLKEFQANGGEVIFMGDRPKYINAKESANDLQFFEKFKQIPFNRGQLLEALEIYRDIDITIKAIDGEDPTKIKHKEAGTRANNVFYQMRNDNDKKWLFICHVNKPVNEHIVYTEELKIKIKGEYKATVYNTVNGQIYPIFAEYENGNTLITHYWSQHDSLLLNLAKRDIKDNKNSVEKATYSIPQDQKYLPQPKNYILEEKNVYLLDLAEYAFDYGEWNKEEEILRIDNLFREKLKFPLRMEALAQPWLTKDVSKHKNTLNLRYRIYSEVNVCKPELAMEHPEQAKIYLNGVKVPTQIRGWYVDESIRKIQLPDLIKGENILEINIPFGKKTNVEWCYLLGDFGIEVYGREKKIIDMPENIYYGDFTRQRLPFYAGNLTYETFINCECGDLNLEVSHYRGALIQVEVDGEKKGNIAFAPYRINCGYVEEGIHKVRLKIYGNRVNAFGAVHNADSSEDWYGPNIWRTQGNKWSYEYQLQPMGILTTPRYWINKN